MVENQQPTPSFEELEAKLAAAMAAGDMDAVLALAPQMKAIKKAKESADWEAKAKEREAARDKLEKALVAVYEKQADAIVALVGFDNVDVSFKLNPAEAKMSCGITKAKIAKAKSSGGGGGTWERADQRSTDSLVEAHKDELMPDGAMAGKVTGKTYGEAYAISTNKNWRYAIRKLLLKM